ncbi:hypothetical protein Tco_1576609 [Tanacetum coccineum]
MNMEIKQEVISVKNELSSLITQEIVAKAPQQFEAFLKNYMQNHVLTLQPSSSTFVPLQKQLYMKMKDDPQLQATGPNTWKVLKAKFEKSSAPLNLVDRLFFVKETMMTIWMKMLLVRGRRTMSSEQQQHNYDGWSEISEIGEDKEISEDASLGFLEEINSLGDKKVLKIADHERMEATLKDMIE